MKKPASVVAGGLGSFDLSGRLDQAMAVRRHGGSMMMVVTVMAVALHLLFTLSKEPKFVKCFCLRTGRGKAENGAVRARVQFTVLAVAMLSVCLAGMAQYHDQDTRGVPTTSATAPPAELRIDINHASMDELLKVPGMTRSWAGRIVRFRPYRSKLDLLDRGVVTSQIYERIMDFVIAHQKAQ
jgi:DNA uptake protein ComE-like DNA-binding protein